MCASKGGTYESFIHSVEDKMRWIRCSGIMYSRFLSEREREGEGVKSSSGWRQPNRDVCGTVNGASGETWRLRVA